LLEKKKAPLGELVSLFRVGKKGKSKGKKGERSEVRTEGKCRVGRTGALYRAAKQQKTKERKKRK
jgi:hypothetical protein